MGEKPNAKIIARTEDIIKPNEILEMPEFLDRYKDYWHGEVKTCSKCKTVYLTNKFYNKEDICICCDGQTKTMNRQYIYELNKRNNWYRKPKKMEVAI